MGRIFETLEAKCYKIKVKPVRQQRGEMDALILEKALGRRSLLPFRASATPSNSEATISGLVSGRFTISLSSYDTNNRKHEEMNESTRIQRVCVLIRFVFAAVSWLDTLRP